LGAYSTGKIDREAAVGVTIWGQIRITTRHFLEETKQFRKELKKGRKKGVK
jgi:hypothetical protein